MKITQELAKDIVNKSLDMKKRNPEGIVRIQYIDGEFVPTNQNQGNTVFNNIWFNACIQAYINKTILKDKLYKQVYSTLLEFEKESIVINTVKKLYKTKESNQNMIIVSREALEIAFESNKRNVKMTDKEIIFLSTNQLIDKVIDLDSVEDRFYATVNADSTRTMPNSNNKIMYEDQLDAIQTDIGEYTRFVQYLRMVEKSYLSQFDKLINKK